MSDLYEVLEIEKTATADEIKKAYRKKSLKCHPDKGGSKEEFLKVNTAYEILIDEVTRARYDGGESADSIRKVKISEEQEILALILRLFVELMEQILPEHQNCLELIRTNLKQGLFKADGLIQVEKLKKKKYETILVKMKSTADSNIFADSAKAQIQRIDLAIAGLEHQKTLGEKALKFLEPYSYEIDLQAAMKQYTVSWSIT